MTVVTAIPLQAFPSPARIDIIDEPPIEQSDPRGAVLFTRRRSQVQPRKYRCVFSARRDVWSALQRHLVQHRTSSFTLRLPGGGTDTVRWASLEQGGYRNNVWVNTAAVLRRVTEG